LGVNNRDFVFGAGGVAPTVTSEILVLSYTGTQVPASQTDLELVSLRIPHDCQVVSAHVWVKAEAGSNAQTVNIQDDGTDICTDTTVDAGAQVAIPLAADPTRIAAGSEIQLTATTGSGNTIDDIQVTLVVRPYPLAEAGIAVT